MLDPLCHLNRCYYTKTLNISYMIKTNPVELRLTLIFFIWTTHIVILIYTPTISHYH